MFPAYFLRLMLDAFAPYEGMTKILDDSFVNVVAKVLDGGLDSAEDDGGRVVGELALGFGVHSHDPELFPHHGEEVVEVPLE